MTHKMKRLKYCTYLLSYILFQTEKRKDSFLNPIALRLAKTPQSLAILSATGLKKINIVCYVQNKTTFSKQGYNH